MRQAMLVVAVACAVGLAWGGEVGTRFEVGDRVSGVGWLQLSGEVGAVTLSGRVEGDLLCGCPRRLQLAASSAWAEISGGTELVILSSGRVDTSVTGSWRALGRTDLGLASARVGGKGTAVDVFGGRFLTAAGWAFGRLDGDPWWVEVNANLAWPGGSPSGELRLGVAGPMWFTLSISSSGSGLELGAEARGFFVQSYLSLRPAFQAITVGVSTERARLQARLTVRAEGHASGSVTLASTQAPWGGSLVVSLSRKGLEKVTAEVRYTLK